MIYYKTVLIFSAQATTYPSLSITSHPNGTYSKGAGSSYTSQLSHHNFSVPQTSIPQTTLSSLPPYSSSSYHSTLGPLTSVPQTVLPFSSVQSCFATSGSTYSTVGTNAFGTSGVGSGTNFFYFYSPFSLREFLTKKSCRFYFRYNIDRLVTSNKRSSSSDATIIRAISSESTSTAGNHSTDSAKFTRHLANGNGNDRSSFSWSKADAKNTE